MIIFVGINWFESLITTYMKKFFKYLEGPDGFFEIKIKVGSAIYRIFCFFDNGNLIILLYGVK